MKHQFTTAPVRLTLRQTALHGTPITLPLEAFFLGFPAAERPPQPRGLPTKDGGEPRFIVFSSRASNLVSGDTNGMYDVFVHDRNTDADALFDEPGSISTTRVSVDSSGAEAIGGDSFPGNGGTACQGNMSADGRFVAFYSYATNLGNSGGAGQVYVHDRDANGNGTFDEPGAIETVMVSVSSSGVAANNGARFSSMSQDGRFVAFTSNSINLDPRAVVYTTHVFVHDRDTDGDRQYDEPGQIATTLVSVGSGNLGRPGNDFSDYASVSADGRFVAFTSGASNLVPGDTNDRYDVFIHDRQRKKTTRINVGTAGGQSSGDALFYAHLPAVSANGRYVAFMSEAADLLPSGADTNDVSDVFVRDNGERWDPQASLPGLGRSGAVGASIEGKGYVLAGATSPLSPADASVLWEYAPGAPQAWRRKAPFPGIPRDHAVAFSIGTKLYVGTGRILGTTFPLSDLWVWDQTTNLWSARASLPGAPRFGAVGFAINGKGYVGTGSGSGALRDFWEFTPTAGSGTWTRKADLPGAPRVHAAGFAMGDSGFIGTGVGLNDFWEYVAGTGTWVQRAPFPGGSRHMAVGFAMNGLGYLCTGVSGGRNKQDIWEYAPGAPGTWLRRRDCPGPSRRAAIGFTLDGKGYLGTGEALLPAVPPSGGRPARGALSGGQRDLWKYTP